MIRGLTSFRWFAFLAVFLFHSDQMLPFGYLGVQAFFVLSGFLITPILVDLSANRALGNYLRTFYGRRALRIFPAYYLYLAIAAFACMAAALRAPAFYEQFVWALAYASDFYYALRDATDNRMLGHFWSLAVEEQFYLLWPLAIYFVPRRNLRGFLLGVIAAGPLLRAAVFVFATDPPAWLNPSAELVVYVLPLTYLDAFAIGGYFALFGREGNVTRTVAVAAASIVLALAVNQLASGHLQLYALGYPKFFAGSGLQVVWGYSLLSLVFALALIDIRDDLLLPAVFNHRTLEYLGKISYGCYIVHLPVIGLLRHYAGLQGIAVVLPALVLTVALSALSYEFFEKRVLRLKDRFFPATPSRSLAPAPS